MGSARRRHDRAGPGAHDLRDREVRVTAASPSGSRVVELRFDGDGPSATLSAAPYGFGWDTRLLSNGVHSLTARAFDVTGAVATHTITVTVANVVQ